MEKKAKLSRSEKRAKWPETYAKEEAERERIAAKKRRFQDEHWMYKFMREMGKEPTFAEFYHYREMMEAKGVKVSDVSLIDRVVEVRAALSRMEGEIGNSK